MIGCKHISGTKKDLQVLENKFITGEYTPEFLVDAKSLCNEDSQLPKKLNLSSKLIVTKQTLFYSILFSRIERERKYKFKMKVKNPNPKKKSNKKEKTHLKGKYVYLL